MRTLTIFICLVLASCSSREPGIVILCDNVEGLQIDSRVVYKGVDIGRVIRFNFYKQFVAVDVRFNRPIQLPANSSFYIQRSLLSGAYILVEPASDPAHNAADTVMAIDRKKNTAEDSARDSMIEATMIKMVQELTNLLRDTTLFHKEAQR